MTTKARPILLLGFALIVAAAWLWLSRKDELGGPASHDPGLPDPGLHDSSLHDPGHAASRGDSSAGPGPTRTASRTAVEPGSVRGERAALRLLVVDSDSKAPLEAARVVSVRDGRIVATTAADGVASVAGHDLSELAFAREGYLLSLFPLGSARQLEADGAAGKTVDLPLVRDRFTIAFAVRFVGPDHSAARGVRFRIDCLDEPPPLGGSLPKDLLPVGEPVGRDLLESWQHHQMIASLPRLEGAVRERYHFGVQSRATTYSCDGEARLRFCAAGSYALEATADGGLVVRQSFEVDIGQTAPLEVAMRPGASITGTVVDANGKPIAGAVLADATPDTGRVAPLVLATTDAAGAFEIGPCPPRAYVLTVAHSGHEERRVGPLQPGGAPLRVVLAGIPEVTFAGIVRRRPTLEAVPGAFVRLVAGGTTLAEASSDTSGRFSLRCNAAEAELVVEAAGFVRWVELVERAAHEQPYACDLLPAAAAARVAAALTGVVEGRVLDAGGKAVPNVPVVLLPQNAPARMGQPGRRVVEGGVLTLGLSAISGADGTFAIEHDASGPARLVVAGMRDDEGRGLALAPGQRLGNLELRATK